LIAIAAVPVDVPFRAADRDCDRLLARIIIRCLGEDDGKPADDQQ
jgi:hypothetical protein